MPAVDFSPSCDLHDLYDAHHGWLQGWLRGKLGNAFEAADLTQDVFMRIMQRRSPDGWGNEPRAFLTHIAKGLLVDHWRRQEVERAYLDAVSHLPEQQVPSPETRFLIIETLCRIETMLRELPDKTRHIFLMAQIDGLKYAEIADRLGMSLITVKRHMRNAFMACMMAI